MVDKLLLTSGLYGSGLIAIRSPLLVGRMNECLKSIGIAPTSLKAFDIDGKGWSPQIAEEKKDPFYLSNGGAIQFAVIITPDQQGKPIYMPFYSFERSMIEAVFQVESKAIADLTVKAGICLEFDPGVLRFDRPEELLPVESVEVRFSDTLGIIDGASRQGALVEKFRSDPMAWSDPSIRREIIDSANCYGDLRYRSLNISPKKFDEGYLDSFCSEAFGGTFVLRAPWMEKPAIFQPEFQDYKLIDRLFDLNLVEVPVDWYRSKPLAVSDLWDSILAEALYHEGEDKVDLLEMKEAQKKQWAVKLMDKLPKEFFEMEKYLKKIETSVDSMVRIGKKLRALLMRPNSELSHSAQIVVWRLIVKITTVSIIDLYLYDKPTFFARYRDWPDLRKMWVVSRLLDRGLCPQEGEL